MIKQILTLGLMLALSTGSFAQSLNDSLKVHLRFNGNANDASGNGNDGSIIGATLTKGLLGIDSSAYEFNGFSATVTIPVADIFNVHYSYSLWFKIDAPLPGSYKAVLLGVGGTDCDQSINLTNQYFNFDGLSAGGYYQVGGTYNANSPAIPAQGEWIHIASVKSSDSIKLFLDGQFITGSPTPSQNPCYFGNNPRGVIGGGVSSSGQYFKGSIDEVRIYSRPLSNSEVASLYNTELTSIKKNMAKHTYRIYPNPNSGQSIFIDVDANVVDAMLYTIQGKIIPIEFDPASKSASLKECAAGTYFLRIRTDDGFIQEKIVVE